MSIEPRKSAQPGSRKEKHLAICTDPSRFEVEGDGAGFGAVHFLHDAMPELSVTEVDPSIEFLGHRLPFPLFISCMTGGSQGGFAANRQLALAAQELGLPVGLGSIRVALQHESLVEHFRVKHIARDVPVLANIGAVQVRDFDHSRIFELLRRLEVQALVVHLNPGQELFQEDGDRDFRGLADALERLCSRCPVPVMVKETGFGIRPSLARRLLSRGAAYVDLAGSGGTNWISVESYRLPQERSAESREFQSWGLPTAALLLACQDLRGSLLASGGIRSGMDAAKAVALGAELAGLALPVIRAVNEGGADAVVRLYRGLEATLANVMVLTGSRTLEELRRGVAWVEPHLAAAAEGLRRADDAVPADRRGERVPAGSARATA
ncbi:MAG TPA: type 2 isopentenyl-diphosphate Delta-isomerase [Spirochaetia bacterium]|nr:type 2 isopentenyl-diphosphate Delta-isomerase [Spirochaetia bacterium]